MLTNPTVVIILRYISISNHQVVYLALIQCYVSVTSQWSWRGKNQKKKKKPYRIKPVNLIIQRIAFYAAVVSPFTIWCRCGTWIHWSMVKSFRIAEAWWWPRDIWLNSWHSSRYLHTVTSTVVAEVRITCLTVISQDLEVEVVPVSYSIAPRPLVVHIQCHGSLLHHFPVHGSPLPVPKLILVPAPAHMTFSCSNGPESKILTWFVTVVRLEVISFFTFDCYSSIIYVTHFLRESFEKACLTNSWLDLQMLCCLPADQSISYSWSIS